MVIKDLQEPTKPIGLDSAIGGVSRMDYINNKSISEGELKKAEVRLRALERWISIYDTDQFGKCSACVQEININRFAFTARKYTVYTVCRTINLKLLQHLYPLFNRWMGSK